MGIYDLNGNRIFDCKGCGGEKTESAYRAGEDRVFTWHEPITLDVMTYNTGNWYIGTSALCPSDNKAVFQAIQEETFATEPDFCFLQDAPSSWSVNYNSVVSNFISPYFAYYMGNTRNNVYGEGHYFCTRQNQILWQTTNNYRANSGVFPGYEIARVQIGDRLIAFINIHDDYRPAYQYADLEDLFTMLRGFDYVIMGGDFNINLSEGESIIDNNQYIANVKQFQENGFNASNCVIGFIPTYYSTAEAVNGKYTDSVVTTSNIVVNNISRIESKIEAETGLKLDHLPFVANLTIY